MAIEYVTSSRQVSYFHDTCPPSQAQGHLCQSEPRAEPTGVARCVVHSLKFCCLFGGCDSFYTIVKYCNWVKTVHFKILPALNKLSWDGRPALKQMAKDGTLISRGSSYINQREAFCMLSGRKGPR